MKDEAAPEQPAMARRVYTQFIIDNTPGAGPDDVPKFDDNAHGVRIALAAIIETTAQVEILEIVLPGFGVGLADGASIAKRQIVDHLKGQDHG